MFTLTLTKMGLGAPQMLQCLLKQLNSQEKVLSFTFFTVSFASEIVIKISPLRARDNLQSLRMIENENEHGNSLEMAVAML